MHAKRKVSEEPLRIVQLIVEDFKRLKLVRWHPDRHVNVISGRNGQGKSSVIDSVFAALCGARSSPKEAVRRGSLSGRAEVDLGDIKVVRTWTKDGSYLSVTDRDGDQKRSPQSLLDGLASGLGMDPERFASACDKDQVHMLLEAFNVDVSDLDAEFKSVTEKRTETNRDAKKSRAAAERITVDERLVAMPIDVGVLRARRRELQMEIDRINGQIDAADHQAIAVSRAADRDRLEGEAEELEYESEKLTAQLDEIREERKRRLNEVGDKVPGLGIDDDGVRMNGIPVAQISTAEKIHLGFRVAIASDPALKLVFIRNGSLLDGDMLESVQEWAEHADVQVLIEKVGDDTGDFEGIVLHDGEIVSRTGVEPEVTGMQTIHDTQQQALDLF